MLLQNIGKPTVPEISLLVDNTNVAVVDPWRKKFSNKFDLGKNRNLFPHQNVISNLHHPVPLSCKDLELSMCIPKSSTVPINTLPRTTIPSKLMDFSNETTPKCSIVTNNNAKCDSKTLRDIYDELLRQGKQPTQCAGEPNCEDLYAMLIDNRNEKQRTIPSNTAERSIQVETITAPKESGLHLPPDIMSFLENFKKSQETTLNEMRQQMYRQISTINEISGQTQSLIDFIATHQNVPKTTGIRSRFEIITEQSDDDEQTCSNGNVRANKYQNGNLQRNFCNQSNTSNGILKVKNDTPKSVTCTKKVLICPPKCQSATNSQTDVNAYDHHLTYDDDNKNQPCCCSKKMMHQCNVNDMTNNYSNPSDIVMVEKSVAWRIQDQTPRRQCQDRHIQLQTHPLQRLDDTENNAQVNGVGHTFYGNILGQVNDVLQNSPSSQAANISPAQQVHEIDGKLLHANETTGLVRTA